MSTRESIQISEKMRAAVSAFKHKDYSKTVDITADIINKDPEHSGAHSLQFNALFESGRHEQARRIGTKTAKLNPTSLVILNNQACLQLDAKQPAAAAGLLKSLIDQYGERSQWLYNLGLAHKLAGNHQYAEQAFARTNDLEPEHDRASFQLTESYIETGNLDAALRASQHLRLLRPNHANTQANHLHLRVTTNTISLAELLFETRLWRAKFIPDGKHYDTQVLDKKRPLHIGVNIGEGGTKLIRPLISPLADWFLQQDDKVTIFWHTDSDPTSEFDPSVTLVDSNRLSDAEFAKRAHADDLDIIIDTCGFGRGNRQRALGLQLAKKQFGWLTHEGHYAANEVQLLDPLLNFYTADLSEDTSRSVLSERTIYGLACHKGLTEQVVRLWAEVLRKLPNWRLQVDLTDPSMQRLLVEQFSREKIDKSRLIFAVETKLGADSIALDNIVENCPVSSIKAVRDGATVITMRGPLHPSQHTARVLAQCGKGDWVCHDYEQFVHDAYKAAKTGQYQSLGSSESHRSKLSDISVLGRKMRAIFLS